MADVTLSLLSMRQESPDTQSFCFANKDRSISYQAGQFFRLALPVDDPRSNWRFFSIASSPTEQDIMIATKISASPFKQALTKLTVGTPVSISGPFGKFTLADDVEKKHIFLAGGIGITPFRSMLKYATDKKLPHKITLLYSNQTPDDIILKEDLTMFPKENPNVHIIHTMTKPEQSKTVWQGRIGRIDETMIRESVKDVANAIFYIAGPPSMVEGLYTIVKGLGVHEENMKTERFTGYQ